MASVRARIIREVLKRLGELDSIGVVKDTGNFEETEIAATLATGKNFAEVAFDDNRSEQGGMVLGYEQVKMSVGIVLWVGQKPADGESWSELGSDLDAELYGIYGKTDELGAWNGDAIQTEAVIAGGAVAQDRTGRVYILHEFEVSFRFDRSDPSQPGGP